MNNDDTSSYNSALEKIQGYRQNGHWPTLPKPQKISSTHLQASISDRRAVLHKMLAKSMTEPWPSMWDQD